MNTPSSFYHQQIKEYQKKEARLKRQLVQSSLLRLFVFLITCLAVYFSFGYTKVVIGSILLGVVVFIFLITRHNKMLYRRDFIKSILQINQTELDVLNRSFYDLPEGNIYKDPAHFYSQDIDLFGRGSFFQYLNRTALESGSSELAHLLMSNHIDHIPNKQEAVKELSLLPEWRQQFSAKASLVRAEVPAQKVVDGLQEYQSFIPKIMKWIPVVFSIASVGVLTGYFTSFISGMGLILWFFIGLGISGIYVKRINDLSSYASKIQGTFQQFYKLLQSIESQDFNSSLLLNQKSKIINDSQSASGILKEFSKLLDGLDQRNNMLMGVLTNAFMLRDIYQVYRIEQWIGKHCDKVEKWFEVIAFFDAYNSLGNYGFNHPQHAYPIINEDDILDIKKASHPLLDPGKSVPNDFKIEQEQFFIITGANMAGKSTFLRTVALQIVMANVGLPVCSEKTNYKPIKLITSMRTTDSLTDDESYFFSELKRLKFIVDQIKKDSYFVILDEILKGTNSTDKAIGSRKFVEKLVASHSTGIIATHDLSLCEAEKQLPQVKNYYFDARIANNELYFDYQILPGVCQNMNASFLLKKMEIVDD